MNSHDLVTPTSWRSGKEWIDVVVTVERPPSAALTDQNRRQKLQVLEEHAQHQRAILLQWIETNGWANDVKRVGPPTGFNLLFIQCTPAAAQALKRAPGVEDVAVTENRITLF